jgi:hypothetical protein
MFRILKILIFLYKFAADLWLIYEKKRVFDVFCAAEIVLCAKFDDCN